METQYHEESYRWVVFASFLLATIVNSLPMQTFSSINVIVSKTFNLTPFQVTLNALIFSIIHPLFSFPCNWLVNKKGMRISYILGAILVCGGVWLRVLLTEGNSFFCNLGSALAAIGNIFIIYTPSKVAFNWFRSDRVPMMIFIFILANMLSTALGASLPGFIIDSTSSQEAVRYFLLAEAIIITIPFILLLLVFRDHPNKPPSLAASASIDLPKQSYKITMKKLFTNIEYIKLAITITLSFGVLSAFMTILDQCLKALGYSNSGSITSIIFLISTPTGILFVPFFIGILKKTQKYRLLSSLCIVGGIACLLSLQLMFYNQVEAKWAFGLVAGTFGIFLTPISSIIVSYTSEVVYPLDEGSSTGYLFAISQTFGFAMGVLTINVLNNDPNRAKIILSIFLVMMLIGLIAMISTKEDLRKTKFEKGLLGKQEESLLKKDIVFSINEEKQNQI